MRTVFEPVFALVAKACPFFDTVDAASMDLLEAGSRRILFDRGCIVFFHGDACDAAFLIAKGSPLDCLSGWGDGVVPVGVPVVAGDVESGEFSVGDLDAFLVPFGVASGPDREPRLRGGG